MWHTVYFLLWGIQYLCRIYKKWNTFKNISSVLKMTAYQSLYIVIVLLPLCKFCTPAMLSLLIRKSTVEVHPITGHEGPEGQWRYTSILYLSSALDGAGGQRHTPGNDLVYCTEGWFCPRASWNACEKSCPNWDPRTVQPIASHCTNYVIVAHHYW